MPPALPAQPAFPQEPLVASQYVSDRQPVAIVEYKAGTVSQRTLFTIRETTLHIHINGQALIRLACTGKHPQFLAVGFLFSCGLIESADDIDGLDITADAQEGIHTHVRLRRSVALPPRTVTSGLGSNFQVPRPKLLPLAPPVTGKTPVWQPENIMHLSEQLNERATLYHATRGCHNSSLCDDTTMLLFHEDIGRHNAIDTIIGQCLLENRDTSGYMILSTGRIASEIVQKVVRARIPVLASTAAATSMAVENALAFNVTLMGRVFADGMWVYNNAGRLAEPL